MKITMVISIGLLVVGIDTGIFGNFIRPDKKSYATFSHNKRVKNTKDTTFLDSLVTAIDKHFLGCTVDSFLKSKLVNRYDEYFFMEGRSGYLIYLLLTYSEGASIEIEPLKFEYLQPVNAESNWDINLFKKEKIGTIRVSNKDSVVLTVK